MKKKTLAAAGIGAPLIAGPLAGAGMAQADNYQDVQFIAALESHGIQSNLLGIPMAYGVCANISNYRYSSGLWPATEYAIDQVYYNTDYSMTYDMSTWFVAAAVVTYCPWNKLGDSNDGGYLA